MLKRKDLIGHMIPLTTDTSYHFGDQSMIEIGAMPQIGFFLEVPKYDMEFRWGLGWNFLSVKSNIDYFVTYSGGDQVRYPFQVHSSGSSFESHVEFLKNWDAIAVASLSSSFRFFERCRSIYGVDRLHSSKDLENHHRRLEVGEEASRQ